MEVEPPLQGVDFSAQTLIVQAGAAPGEFGDGTAGEGGDDGGGGGGVADAHVAGAEQIEGALAVQLVDDGDAIEEA